MPPLATKCVRGKGSSGVRAPRSASQVNDCTKKQNVDEVVFKCECVPKCYLWPRHVSKVRVAPAHCCGGCRDVARLGCVGECSLWPRIVSEAGIALALEPRVLRCFNRKLWRPNGRQKSCAYSQQSHPLPTCLCFSWELSQGSRGTNKHRVNECEAESAGGIDLGVVCVVVVVVVGSEASREGVCIGSNAVKQC